MPKNTGHEWKMSFLFCFFLFKSHFRDVVAAVEAYLDPILTKLHPALK